VYTTIHPGIQEQLHSSSSSSAAKNSTAEGETPANFSSVSAAAVHTSAGEQDNVASITTHASTAEPDSLVSSSSFTSAQQSIFPFKNSKEEEEEKED
jgi:hypothetical protein